MAINDTQRMWLHDEAKTINVLPYTTLDSIKVRTDINDDNIDNYESFEEDYNEFKTAVETTNNSFTNSINNLSNRIDNIDITQSIATSTSDGLMSKEDKTKLDNIAEGAMSYVLPPATQSSLGGIIVGQTLNIDGNGVLNANIQDRTLNSLSDVLTSSPTNHQVLGYDSTSGKWINQNAVATIDDLDNIGNVTITNPMNNHVLKYVSSASGGYWENGEISFSTITLNSFVDVDITNPVNGEYLVYDSTTGHWKNSSSNNINLEDLDNVTITTPIDGQVLKYDATNSIWINDDESGGGGNIDVLSYDDTLEVLGLPANPIYAYKIATPIMTSNTTPSGEVSASSYYGQYLPFYVFKQVNDNTYSWVTSANDTIGAWIKYHFEVPKQIINLEVYNRTEAGNPRGIKQFKFQASNDDVNWTDLATCDIESSTPGLMSSYEINNELFYEYYRLYVTDVYDNMYVGFGCINMYERYLI